MTNRERILLETKGINLQPSELDIYLQENGLDPNSQYDANNKATTRMIYETALSILESIANQPNLMRTMTYDDMTVSQFHENLMARIDQLENKIRKMKIDESKAANTNGSFFMLFDR